MAIYVKTSCPGQLIDSIKQKIYNHEIITWNVDSDGDYTINRDQWEFHAWFRIISQNENNRVTFGIIQSKRYPMTNMLYGVYHGRMVETLLIYFSNLIDNIEVTPDPIREVDIIREL